MRVEDWKDLERELSTLSTNTKEFIERQKSTLAEQSSRLLHLEQKFEYIGARPFHWRKSVRVWSRPGVCALFLPPFSVQY
jgi:hypothetical protein